MKKFKMYFGIIGFLLVMTSPTFATDLLGTDPYWPSKPPEAKQGMNSETRRSVGGVALGAILGKVVSSDPLIVAASAVLGGVFAGEWDAHTKKREAALIAAQPSKNCRVVIRTRTNPKTGQLEAGYDETCDEMRHRDLPYAEMIPPGTANYKHDGEQVSDSRAGLSEGDRKFLDERDAAERGIVLDSEEQKMLEEFRNKKQGAATATPSPTAYMTTRVSYTSGCQLYVDGVVNPGC